MSTTAKIVRRVRARREAREFDSVLRNASPAMQQELMAAAIRQFSR